MSDKYPSVNPYLYCAGNPIKYVDPTGNDIWDLDNNGFVIRQIKDETKDALVMNGKEIDFAFGTIKCYGNKFETMFLFNDISSAKDAFKFLADNSLDANSLVEYGLIVTQDKSCIVTQHLSQRLLAGHAMIFMNNIYGNIIERYHNHPRSSAPSGFTPGSTCGDKIVAEKFEEFLGYQISWYIYKSGQKTFQEYIPAAIINIDISPWILGFGIEHTSFKRYFPFIYNNKTR